MTWTRSCATFTRSTASCNKESAHPDQPFAPHVSKNAGMQDPTLDELKHKFGAFEQDKDKCSNANDLRNALEGLVDSGGRAVESC